MKLMNVCGARPNFMKIAPLMRAFGRRPAIQPYLVHTGQHYDAAMNDRFFAELRIPPPDCNLEVGSASHAMQTAAIMQRFEPVVQREQPDAVLVVGDVNSTIACALVAVKLGVPVFHVEAGLRSFDRAMPEEINRVLTDAISELLFVTEKSGVANLLREGVPRDRIHLVGNVMIDSLREHQRLAAESRVLEQHRLAPRRYAVLTLHRPSNVDDGETLGRLIGVLERLDASQPIVFPIHPRTRAALDRNGLAERVARLEHVRLLDPLGYLDFLRLLSDASFVLTDSGGIQEETTVLGVPCLTLRTNTERPVTIEQGTNQLVGVDPERILRACAGLRHKAREPRTPELWDGQAAERIADVIARWGQGRRNGPAHRSPVGAHRMGTPATTSTAATQAGG
ncbi:MAG: non-hydrolyzing UDP-N-acetylglucosamine 2-epimerase [Phycisphaerae bacterium]